MEPSFDGQSDKQFGHLLARAREGCTESLGEILQWCRQYLLLIANQEIDSDLRAKAAPSDLVQDTFLEAQRDFAQFRGGTRADLLGWLRHTLLNNLNDFTRHYRQRQKCDVSREMPIGGCDSGAVDDETPSRLAMRQEESEIVQRALSQLPEDYRLVIRLRYWEQHSLTEISQIMSRSREAVRKLWFRAIERLEHEIDGER